jgi:hypothetical protein
MLPEIEGELSTVIAQAADTGRLQQVAQSMGMQTLQTRIAAAVAAGHVSSLEVDRG